MVLLAAVPFSRIVLRFFRKNCAAMVAFEGVEVHTSYKRQTPTTKRTAFGWRTTDKRDTRHAARTPNRTAKNTRNIQKHHQKKRKGQNAQ
jgi:hypothetical protein